MRYAKIREMDISNGEGIGIALFVQGCHFHCKGCFNSETWDFDGGHEWTDEVKNKFIELANRPFVKRITILGGEPLCDENIEEVLSLIYELKSLYPDKKLWLYTGYNVDNIWNDFFKTLTDSKINDRLKAVINSDVVVDGLFEIENQDLYNENIVFAGSTNQRIIHVKEWVKNK